MENLSQVLEKIKGLRIQKGKSQTQMAELLGITQAGYANIESNSKGKLSLVFAVGIAKALEVGFNELYDIDGDSQKIDGLNKEIEALKKRIAELEELVGDKRRIIEYLTNDDIAPGFALYLRNTKTDYDPKKRDFNDLDALLREIGESEKLDENAKQYIIDHFEKLKHS